MSQQDQTAAKKTYPTGDYISRNVACKVPKISLPLHSLLICVQLDYLILARCDTTRMAEMIWEKSTVRKNDWGAKKCAIQGGMEITGTT